MIERLNFGKGNIIVTSTINALIIKCIDTQLQIGDIVNMNLYSNNYKLINQFTITFNNYNELKDFKGLITNVYQDKTFSYKNLMFDFSDYNRKSVDCIMD